MSYMRGMHYLWCDAHHLHVWAAAGYDGWDESGWASGQEDDAETSSGRPNAAPSGVALPQAVADEYVLLRLAELIASGDAVAALERALDRHAGNGGAGALVALAEKLRPVLASFEVRRGTATRGET